MKRFLLNCLLYSMIPLGLLLGLEYAFRSIPSNYTYKYQYLDSHAEEIECLVLGSSLELNGINPKLLNCPAFNAAISAQPPEMDSVLLSRFLPHMKSLRVLVMPLSWFSVRHAPLCYSIYRFEYHDKWSYDCHGFQKRDRLALLCYKPSTMFPLIVHHIIDSQFSFQTCDSLGWYPMEGYFSDWLREDQMSHTQEYADDYALKCGDFSAKNLSLYRWMIGRCAERDVKVILISTPYSALFLNHLDSTVTSNVIAEGHMLESECPNVIYLDLFHDPRFPDSLFSNSNHLNRQGAERLTQILDSVIEQTTGKNVEVHNNNSNHVILNR